MEQVYRVLINKIESDNPEDVRFGKYCYLFNDKIYTSVGELPIEALEQLEGDVPEIKVKEFIVSGNPKWDSWQIVHDSEGTHLVHCIGNPDEVIETPEKPAKRNGRPKIELPEDKIKELAKQGLGSKAIATRLRKDGCKTSYKTVQRMLAGVK